ncbi:hypothetical protein AAG906_016378 [Vitis piasezkii]
MPFSIPFKTHFPSSSLTSASFHPSLLCKMISATTLSPPPTHLPSLPQTPPLSLIKTCKSMAQLKQIHSQTIRTGLISNPIVPAQIIAFCCKHELGDMEYARMVFDTMPEPNHFVWNNMIKGILVWGCHADEYTYPLLLKRFTGYGGEVWKELHDHIVKLGFSSNVFVQNALIHLYSLSGEVSVARGVFDRSSKSDVVTWNVMISGYNRSKQFDESMKLFDEMERMRVLPSSITLVSVLKRVHQYVKDLKIEPIRVLENALIDMYAACGDMDTALGIFDNMKSRDVISWTAIATGFTNLGQVDLARKYFDKMPERDFVSWTAMIDGYLQVNRFKEVLTLFFTMVSILTACAHLGALELGEWIKAYIDKNEIKIDSFVGNALIDMYFNCGNVEKAIRIFNAMPHRDKISWTAVIFGLAINGYGEEALDMFSQMLKASITPDEVTYIGVLCAFLAQMTTQHGIEPNVAHYGCMVDLLGRAGHLKEAHEVIKNMPVKPNSIVWGSLLGACRVHRDEETAEMAAQQILELEPENGAVYVLLCNIYAACNRWEKLHEVRKLMMDRGIKKTPGCSLIEMNGSVHEFVAGDQVHPQSKEIYSKLDEMSVDLKFAGYSPDTSEVFLDIGEEEKESAVYRHSEKLAIAFGLISSGPGVTIRIVKNLRMCVDCHYVAKLVSKVYNREVIVRDRTRFHHFRHGSCSCKDYW